MQRADGRCRQRAGAVLPRAVPAAPRHARALHRRPPGGRGLGARGAGASVGGVAASRGGPRARRLRPAHGLQPRPQGVSAPARLPVGRARRSPRQRRYGRCGGPLGPARGHGGGRDRRSGCLRPAAATCRKAPCPPGPRSHGHDCPVDSVEACLDHLEAAGEAGTISTTVSQESGSTEPVTVVSGTTAEVIRDTAALARAFGPTGDPELDGPARARPRRSAPTAASSPSCAGTRAATTTLHWSSATWRAAKSGPQPGHRRTTGSPGLLPGPRHPTASQPRFAWWA